VENNCWIYQGECLYEPPSGYYGFIYRITLSDGTFYIGKKAFEHNQKKVLSKKARALSGTRKRIERVKKDSGWLEYWGSSKAFIEHIDSKDKEWDGGCRKNATRKIVKLCKDKASLSYWEMVTLVQNDILFRTDCWNGNISGKYFKGKIHE